ncbi:hypothetical protein Golob_026481 [Gossypium lobatum]|uniref:Uncharacterized protein n=1 Tax=Gossypium lobatum TaxID=34289 RepID=A0A7J8LV88_9ROSI|nr:hypothetical protein [Gossypium lobatum]
MSPLSVATLYILKYRPHQKWNRKLPGGTVRHFDNNNPSLYLVVGWLVG